MVSSEIRSAEVEYCRSNIEYFVRCYCHIEDKEAQEIIQPFNLWPRQSEALKSIHEHRLNIILKARQLGMTWLALAYAAYTIVCYQGRSVVCLSRTEDGAKELIRRLTVILRNMRALICEAGSEPYGWSGATFKATALDITIMFPDGPQSVCKAFPSGPGAARGFTADLLVLDEWAFQQFADEIWQAVFPTINRPYGGKVIGLSTIERGTLFEKLFVDEDNGFNKIFLPWTTDPARNEEWYEKTKKALGEAKTLQEYPLTVEEALTIPGGAFFPEVKRTTHEISVAPAGPIRRYACLDYGLDMLSVHWIAVDTRNKARIYREYDAPDKIVGAAAEIILELSKGEDIEMFLAPPDLWNRSQESGKSRAQLFSDAGLTLTKTSNDFPAGCAAMKEWFAVDPAYGMANLVIMEGAAPNLWNCLQKIQKDKLRPNVYAKEPHDLTHDVDSVRCFCVYWTHPAMFEETVKKHRWEPDMIEDYKNASKSIKERMVQMFGYPK